MKHLVSQQPKLNSPSQPSPASSATPSSRAARPFVVRRWSKDRAAECDEGPGAAVNGGGASGEVSETVAQHVGHLLFKHRSYTLVPLGMLIVLAAGSDIGRLVSWEPAIGALRLLGLVLLAVGEAMRFVVAACSHRGTSGRGMTLRASTLVTGGLYAHTRNPLYLANAMLWVGASLLIPSVPLALLAVVLVGWQYHLIIRAEERFLMREHGAAYQAYCDRVPRIVPGLSIFRFRHAGPQLPGVSPATMDWSRGLFREHDTIFLVVLGVWGIMWLQAARFPSEALSAVPGWLWPSSLAVASGLWLATKVAKKARRRRR